MFNFLKGKKFPLTDFLPHPTIFLLSFTSLFPSLSLLFFPFLSPSIPVLIFPLPFPCSLFPSLVPSSLSLPFFPTFYFLHYIPRDVPTILRKSTVVWVETWGFPPGAGNGKWGGAGLQKLGAGGCFPLFALLSFPPSGPALASERSFSPLFLRPNLRKLSRKQNAYCTEHIVDLFCIVYFR